MLAKVGDKINPENTPIAEAHTNETLEWLNNYTLVRWCSLCVTIDIDKTSINLNENMDIRVLSSKTSDLPFGWLCGQTTHDFVKAKTGRSGIIDV